MKLHTSLSVFILLFPLLSCERVVHSQRSENFQKAFIHPQNPFSFHSSMFPKYDREEPNPSYSARQRPSFRRITLSNIDDDEDNQDDDEDGPSTDVISLKRRIIAHKLKISGLMRDIKDVDREKALLEKTIMQKKSETKAQNGEVKVNHAELEAKEREIAMYRHEAPKTLSKYNELIRAQKELQVNLNRLSEKSKELTSYKMNIVNRIQSLNMDEIIERHARGLPDAMAGALRKSAAALVPFFDYLAIAADTNNRLVDHVGAEIDRFAHVNIQSSPFLSGLLFYCVILIPLLTLISFARRIFDSSNNLTVSHYIIFGNLYFILMCGVNILVALFMHRDPSFIMFQQYEKSFVVANLLLAAYYVWHTVIMGVQTIVRPDRGKVSQLAATLSVGIHYFIFTWRRVFTDAPPEMYTGNYMVYGTIFSFILYERVSSMSKKQLSDSKLLQVWVAARSGKLAFSLKGVDLKSVVEGGKYLVTQVEYTVREWMKTVGKVVSWEGVAVTWRKWNVWRAPRRYESDESGPEEYTRRESRRMLNSGRTTRSGGRDADSQSRGFVSIFFGNHDDDKYDSEESESESEGDTTGATGTWWRLFPRREEASVATRSTTDRMKRGSTSTYRKGPRGRTRD